MKEILLVLTEALVHQIKCLVLILEKQRQSFAWVCITIVIIVICFVNRKKCISLKQILKMSTLQTIFLGCISNKIYACLIKFEAEKVSLKKLCFLFNYDAIDKSDILNIRKYLMVKNNIK